MTVDTVKMDIRKTTYNPLCSGPVEYHIFWVCRSCKQENTLVKKGSLLHDEKAICNYCGTSNLYSYDEVQDQKYEKYFSKCTSMEYSIFEKITQQNQPEIFQLGQNFLFGVFAYLSATLRNDDV